MKPNHTDITIVLDRSGSMLTVAGDTIGGFNQFLKTQKAVPGTANITLHQFNHEFETIMDGVDIQSAQDLTPKTFIPDGYTALLDAIGKAINNTGNRLKNKPEDERAEHVVFVIITDGQENNSKEFSLDAINKMIKHQTDVYKWQFVFLGAQQDAIQTGANIGISAQNAMSYADNAVGTQAMFSAVGQNLQSYRTNAKEDMSWETEQREAQLKAGAKPDSMTGKKKK